ncbi:hypothetical protein FIV42_21175 [Persicimonas caeni]|uniref:Uncharacterized protein n=1 Tax=Persicimonas caeni TaxID=2292766 RepID=A0A4Y6PY33_PERCE|nr:hypothetical protein [Persicimonas caeni]QDG53163.1 hypothetical protein FIV42_21175 [Persicimonas caeni]QED34385.1 hypothetical protein FRD00_21170 [Persicimonas caeni]
MACLDGVGFGDRRFGGVLAAILLVGAVMLLPSCVDEGDGFPDIVSVTVSPSTISQNQTAGMTDQFFDIQVTVADFAGQIEDADVFIQLQGDERFAAKEGFEATGNTIDITGVRYAWFVDLEPGDYNIGARVVSDAGESVQELDLATVRVTP